MEAAYQTDSFDQEQGPGIKDYLAVANRRKLHFAGTSVLIFAIAAAIIFTLPPLYRSTASILIESQQIPAELIRSTISGFAEERIEFIRQKVLTRANIIGVIDKYDLYQDDRDSSTTTELVAEFRERNELELLTANAGRNQPTIAFKLSFEDPSAKRAQMVTNEIVTLFLNENAKTRAERAAETTEFLTSESERIRTQIQAMESRIAEFKLGNSRNMPEVFQMNLAMLERLEREHQSVSLNLEGFYSEMSMLELQFARHMQGAGSTGADNSLSTLLRQRQEMLNRYTEEHPNLRSIDRKIAAIREARAEESLEEVDESPIDPSALLTDPAYEAIATRIASTRNKITYLESSKADLTAEIDNITMQIAQAPMVEKEYKELMRDFDNLQGKYQELKNKEMEARIAQNLEEDRKGERFSLLEPPIVPQDPSKPERGKLLAIAAVLALGAGAGLVILLELLDPALRGQNAFVRALGVTPLVTIPYIDTVADEAKRRHRIRWLIAAVLVGGCGLVAAVHFIYMDLDVLWYSLMRRLGAL